MALGKVNRSAMSRCEFRFPRYHSVAARAVAADVGCGLCVVGLVLLNRSIDSSLPTSS